MSKDFTKLVLIDTVLALPIAWYAMDPCLRDYAYKVEIKWRVFLLAGLLASITALLTNF